MRYARESGCNSVGGTYLTKETEGLSAKLAFLGPRQVDGDAALQLDDFAAAAGGRTAVAAPEGQARTVCAQGLARSGGFAAVPGAACGDFVGILKIAVGA